MEIRDGEGFFKDFLVRTREILNGENDAQQNYDFTMIINTAIGMAFVVKEMYPEFLDSYPKITRILSKELTDEIKTMIYSDMGEGFREPKVKFWIKKCNKIVPDFSKISVYDFLRHFRNAFAHIRIRPINGSNGRWHGIVLRVISAATSTRVLMEGGMA